MQWSRNQTAAFIIFISLLVLFFYKNFTAVRVCKPFMYIHTWCILFCTVIHNTLYSLKVIYRRLWGDLGSIWIRDLWARWRRLRKRQQERRLRKRRTSIPANRYTHRFLLSLPLHATRRRSSNRVILIESLLYTRANPFSPFAPLVTCACRLRCASFLRDFCCRNPGLTLDPLPTIHPQNDPLKKRAPVNLAPLKNSGMGLYIYM
jgi:hypothetical protein